MRKHLKMVTGYQRSQPRIEGWNLSVPPSDLVGRESHGRLNQSPMVNNLTNHAYVMKPPEKLKRRVSAMEIWGE